MQQGFSEQLSDDSQTAAKICPANTSGPAPRRLQPITAAAGNLNERVWSPPALLSSAANLDPSYVTASHAAHIVHLHPVAVPPGLQPRQPLPHMLHCQACRSRLANAPLLQACRSLHQVTTASSPTAATLPSSSSQQTMACPTRSLWAPPTIWTALHPTATMGPRLWIYLRRAATSSASYPTTPLPTRAARPWPPLTSQVCAYHI